MSNGSRLFYFGTNDEVQIGDRIRIKRWLRSDLYGVVCYIPGISDAHPSLEYDDVRKWAIQHEDGSLGVMGYDPENRYGQPGKGLTLVSRGECEPLDPNEELE